MRVVPISEAAEPIRLPDLIWNPAAFFGDIAVDVPPPEILASSSMPASSSEPVARSPGTGDLVNGHAIETAVLICLMTDRRVEPYELPEGESNRGWPGDGFDIAPGEPPLGSKLWLLRRRALEPGIEVEAEDYAREALDTLLTQMVAVRADVSATAERANNRLVLDVALFGRDGAEKYHNRFAVLWEQIDGA